MFTDIIKVLIASFFCIAISVFIFIVLYITHEWAKYLFYKCFPKLYEIR